jgi:hypothetical protein
LGKPPWATFASEANDDGALQLVPQSFFMPVRLHAFAALVLGYFCFPSLF